MPEEYIQSEPVNPIVENLLLNSRRIFINEEITNTSSKKIIMEIQLLSSIDDAEPIYLYINSNGGCIVNGLAIIDAMDLAKAPIYTICRGAACSMGAYILMNGEDGHRYTTKNSTIMMHPASYTLADYQPFIDIAAKFNEKMDKKLAEYGARKCKKTIKDFRADIIHGIWLYGKEAVKYGCVDAVWTPTLERSIQIFDLFEENAEIGEKSGEVCMQGRDCYDNA